jgi:uncharacterized protein (TIGR02646 family)
MHRLDKSTVPTPACCQLATDGRRYTTLHGHEKAEIRTRLLELQKHRCAYCERRTAQGHDDGHIEHFRNQAGHDHLSLEWANLYWSCNDEKTCGKHKDKCTKWAGALARFDPDDLIDPGIEDPEGFLLFVTDGTVRPVEGLDGRDLERAIQTLRVFQLNDSAYLRTSREDALKPYISTINSLASAGQEIVVGYVKYVFDEGASAPFGTAIRQYLRGFLA